MSLSNSKRALRARKFSVACGMMFCCCALLTTFVVAEDTTPVSPADPVAALPPAPQENSASTPASTPAPDIAEPDVSPPSTSLPSTSAPSTPVASRKPAAIAPRTSLKYIVHAKGLALPLPQARIVIDKSARRLDLLSGSTLVKSYRVSLGKNPVGAKKSQGDGRTPEGRFYICTRNAQNSGFHIFLGLSYPALPDAKRAVNSKQISWREYQIINQRIASRAQPPWGTRLGGWVGIHGGTDANFAQKQMQKRGTHDWTAGCIGLTNREIDEIYAATKLGTPVEIKP